MIMNTADCTIVIPTLSIAFRLHRQRLTTRSLFFKRLFEARANLIPSFPSLFSIPPSQLPRLLPSPPSHPILYLPLPDPSSIQPLLTWMYTGNTDHIEDALGNGDIQWQGLARNVEYLALATDIKVFLGRWYRQWLLPVHSPSSPCLTDDDDDDVESEPDMNSEYDGSDDDAPSTPPDHGMPVQLDDEWDRGRTRHVKPIASHALVQLHSSF